MANKTLKVVRVDVTCKAAKARALESRLRKLGAVFSQDFDSEKQEILFFCEHRDGYALAIEVFDKDHKVEVIFERDGVFSKMTIFTSWQ